MSSFKNQNIGLMSGWDVGENGWGDDMNNNLSALDILCQPRIKNFITTLPMTTSAGDAYILNNKNIIVYNNKNQYQIIIPKVGWKVFNINDNKYYIYTTKNKWEVGLSSDIDLPSDMCYASSNAVKKLKDSFTSLLNDHISDKENSFEDISNQIEDLHNIITNLDSWSIYPPYSPIAVYNITLGGSDNRRIIFHGETNAREEWIICDGGSDGNGGKVPDLRGKFIMGQNSSYPVGKTGGSLTHRHTFTGSVGSTTLSVAQLASHSHTFSKGTYGNIAEARGSANDGKQTTDMTGSSQPHTHSLSAVSSESSNNLPPFYSLYYIIKIPQS